MSSLAVESALAAAQSGEIVAAARMLEAAAAERDGHAALQLAEWRLAGDPLRRDLTLARRYYGRAAKLGIAEAEPAYTALLANGAGGSGREWRTAIARLKKSARRDGMASRQLDILGAMKIDTKGDPRALPDAQTLHERPLVRSLPTFLSREECRYLSDMARPRLEPALIIDARTGQLKQHPIRTAQSAGFSFVNECPALHAINRRIAAATGTVYEQGEPTQILSYAPGEEYKLHSDAVANEPNQRVMTFLITLEDDFTGGETVFPRLGLVWRGKTGDALHFHNIDGAGRAEPLAWHAGAPVTRGRKVLLSKWIRENPLDLSGPPGRPL